MGDLVRGQEFRSWLDLLECVFKRMIDCLKATKVNVVAQLFMCTRVCVSVTTLPKYTDIIPIHAQKTTFVHEVHVCICM